MKRANVLYCIAQWSDTGVRAGMVMLQLKSAIAGKKDLFVHVNIDWDLVSVSNLLTCFHSFLLRLPASVL